MKKVVIILTSMLVVHTAFGMVGAPLFCIGRQLTSMTVEASKVNLESSSPSADNEKASAASERLVLTARYGLAQNVDIQASLGAANLVFTDLTPGFSDFDASWCLAWGAGVRVGLPVSPHQWQVVGAVNYAGFQPHGNTGNGVKNISSKYLWHEISPSVTFGMRFGNLVPYVGATKPFLLGRRDIDVTLNGQEFPSAGGRSDYTDSEQPVRGILGLEWKLPEGYSITTEAAATTDGIWTVCIGVAQVLR